MDSPRKEVDWTELRPMDRLENSPSFEEFRKEAEKAVCLVWQLSTDEKVEALFVWNRLATKLQEIITKATDEMMNDIVELTSCTSSSNSNVEKTLEDDLLATTSQHPHSHGNGHRDNSEVLDIALEISEVLGQSESDSVIFSESFILIDTESSSKMAEPEIRNAEYFPNIFSPGSQNACDLTIDSGSFFSKIDDATPQKVLGPLGVHQPEKSWTCNICSERLSDEKQLEEHISTTHTSKRYKCKECTCSFSTKGNLNVHIRNHSGERPFACPKCPVRFTSGGNLRRHLLSHQGLKPYQCSMCESRFTEKKSLLIHQRSHSGEKPYACTKCEKRFAQNSILQSHLSVHSSEKPYLCHQCGKSFKQKQQLAAHETRHRGAKNQICDKCDASFITKGDLTRHRKSHLGVKPFLCDQDQCKKTFMRRQSLMEHLNRHLGVKPLQCSKCDKAFDDLSSYHKHVQQH